MERERAKHARNSSPRRGRGPVHTVLRYAWGSIRVAARFIAKSHESDSGSAAAWRQGLRSAATRGARATAPHGFEETDTRTYRDVEAVDLAAHGNAHEEIATLAREAPHAFAFGAQHPRDDRGQVRFIQRLRRALVGTDDPHL